MSWPRKLVLRAGWLPSRPCGKRSRSIPTPEPTIRSITVSRRKTVRPATQHVDTLELCQQLLGYRFYRIELLEEALNRSTAQRLALVGDCALRMAFVTRFYSGQATLTEWNLSCQRSMSNERLQDISFQLGLHHLIIPPAYKGLIGTPATTKKYMADALEAILGAVFEDSLAYSRTIDWDEFDSIVLRLGIIPEILRTYADRREVHRTTRTLPKQFFKGNHAALNELLFQHGSAKITSVPLRKPLSAASSSRKGSLTSDTP